MNEQEEDVAGMHLPYGEGDQEEDPLSKRFQFYLDETEHVLHSAPQPYSDQYHSLPDINLPKFYGNPSEFHKFYSVFACLVDRNPKIPKIMKLHLLNDALRAGMSKVFARRTTCGEMTGRRLYSIHYESSHGLKDIIYNVFARASQKLAAG